MHADFFFRKKYILFLLQTSSVDKRKMFYFNYIYSSIAVRQYTLLVYRESLEKLDDSWLESLPLTYFSTMHVKLTCREYKLILYKTTQSNRFKITNWIVRSVRRIYSFSILTYGVCVYLYSDALSSLPFRSFSHFVSTYTHMCVCVSENFLLNTYCTSRALYSKASLCLFS